MRDKADKRLWTLSIVGCVIVVLTVLFVSVKIETNNTKNRIHSTMEYIKDQYSMYNSFNEAVEARSLVRMVEKVQQTARNFKTDKQALEKEYLKQYAREQRLTGIIVLNDKNKQIAQYHTGPKFKKVLGYVMEKETLRDVKNYPQKSYMARIELKNGGYIDLASYGRKDAKGTVIGYQYVKTEYAKNNNLTIQNVLAGYKRENDGTIVITNGNDIIASNDKKLIDTKVEEDSIINEIRQSVKVGQFAIIRNGIKQYFTSLDKGRNYYIYVYAEDRNLVKTLTSNIGIAVILYGIFVAILMTIKARSNQQYERIQKQREEEYKKELEKELLDLGLDILNGLLFWELRQVMQIEKWKEAHSADLPRWIEAIGAIDAYCSLATFSYNHPDYIYPQITSQSFHLQAEALGHPLMDRNKCVRNGIDMEKRPFFIIITGANMAGKSTYLRTVGVNYLLACIGAPVWAAKMEIFPARLVTSLRTSDSLTDNESYFFAELKRLKLIIDKLKAGEELFIILDEILKGTNSMDKQKGSFALIKQFMSMDANGIIATHDLLLGTLIDAFPQNIRNYCFEADITNNELTFSYQMRSGVAQNMNACFLMKKMGIAVIDG